MLENNVAKSHYGENSKLLTSESEFIIRRFLTKQMIRILILLFNCDMINKELSEKMKLSASALSNILQRMKKCEVPLLETIKKDKYILYSLTPIAYEYTEKFLTVKGIKDLKIVRIHENETLEMINCRNALEKMKEKLGDDWSVDFLRYCVLYYEADDKGKLVEADLFFEALEMLIINEQFVQFDCIINELENEDCQKMCLKYVNKYISVRRLCSLDAENWKMAYQFIDDLFIGEVMCISFEFLEKSGDLSKEDIVKMANGLLEIINYSKIRKLTKGDFLDAWSKYFMPHEKLIYYIAEKYGNKYSNR